MLLFLWNQYMFVEPKKIEPKFFSRFIVAGLILLKKAPFVWLVFALVSFSVAFIFAQIPFPTQFNIYAVLTKVALGLWLFFLGLEFAAHADYNSFKIKKIFQYFQISLKHTVFFIRDNLFYLLIVSLVLIIFSLIFSMQSTPFDSSDSSPLHQTHLIYFLYMSAISFWGVVLSLHRSRIFYYAITRQFSIDDKNLAYALSEKALIINPQLKFFIHVGFPILIITMPIYSLIIGIPLFIPMVSILIYIAFKEIFLNKKESVSNPVENKAPLLKELPAPTSS